MGYGDEIIGSGLARKAVKENKLIAFGNGKTIIWSSQAREIYQNNPCVAPPGSEVRGTNNLEWINWYPGQRGYGTVKSGRWIFKDFECPRGEIFFSESELRFGNANSPKPFVVVEPRVKLLGACAGENKQWPIDRYEVVAKEIRNIGFEVVQLVPAGKEPLLANAEVIKTENFRLALSVLKNATLYIGPEGGLHHGAAAVGVPAVVIFGGFNTPKSTGYNFHENIAVGEPCGSINKCSHCAKIMKSISAERVLKSAYKILAQ